MKLYVMKGACSLASHIALRWAEAPFDLIVLSHRQVSDPEFAKVNAKASVPALQLDDGEVLTESLAILHYIAARHPEAGLGAEDGDLIERARLDEALADLVSEVHKAWAPVFAPQRFSDDPTDHAAIKDAAFRLLDGHYRRWDAKLEGRHWALSQRGIADAYLYVLCGWKDMTPQKLAEYPSLAAFKARLDGDDSVRAALAAEEDAAPC